MFRRVHRTTLDRRSAEVNVSTRGVVLAAAFMVSAGAVSVWGAAPVQGSAPRAAAVVPEPGLPVTPAVAGTPAPPSLVWREDFENNMGTTPWAVNYSTVKYTGTNSETYTGLTGWLNVAWCNGLVVAVQTTVTGGAATVGGATCIYVDQLKQLAYALGTFNGSAVVNNNHVVAAFTAGSPGAGPMVQLEQLKTLPLGLNRFVLLSLSGAAMNCGVGAPSYQFAYTKDLTTWNLVGTAINLCTSTATSTVSVPTIGTAGARADVKVGRVYSPTTFLLTGSTVAVRVGNANGGGAGNDAAFDDLTIWDATPILDKSFSPTTIAPNGVSTLTLRITNTDDLAEKKGWSFTDTFPTGLKVANPPTASTTCGTGTTVSAVAGSGVVSVTGGNLVAGAASCLVKVNVTAAAEGQYTNGAANIDPKIGMDLPLAPATLTVFAPNPKLAVTKVASPTTVTAAGQPVSYTITAKNTGNVALTNVSVSDPKVGTLSCTPTIPVATLAINASISCTGSYTATQADVDAGSIANTATATGTPPSGPAITGTGSATVTATRTPGLSVVKSVTPTMFTNPGETLNYTITATNTGNVSLTNVSVSDPKVSSLLCSPTIPVAKLAPGAQVVCSGSRVVSNADVTANIITNTATATGTPPTGSAITASGSATATGLPRNPSLAVTKTASPTAMTTVGETITYTIRATNDGDAVLTNVTVSDPMVSGLMCLPAIPVASLGLGESISCQGTYTVKQSDLDSSTPLENTATASGDSTAGSASKSAKATVTKVAAPALTVAKTVSPTSFLLPGEILNYQIRVTNTGNVTVSNVSVSDPKVSSLNCAPSLPVTSLAPGAQILCTASRTVTNSDVVAGSVVNTATASGTAPGGAPVSGSDTATSTGSPLDPKLDVTKTASPTAFSRVGETVSYTITAVNTGNVPLTNVSVSDPKAGPLSCTPALPVATLAVGASITCLGTSVVTQADVDAGSIVNTASASGTSPLGGFVGDAAALTVPGPVAAPQLSLSKSASPSTYTAAGDLLTYTIVATNTGNVTLSNVIVLDPGVASLSCSAPVPVPSLAPGERVTCTGTRAVLQVEVDSGSVANTATASGTAPGSVTVADSASTVVNGLPAAPRLSVTKTAAQATFTGVDSVIDYTVTLTNIGTATLKDLAVSDTLGTPSCTPTLSGLRLAPGESTVCTYSYTVTGLDATNARVDNTASASAKSLSGIPTSDEATLSTPGPVPAPQLSVSKVADPVTFGDAGDTVNFTIIATNTGNVPLANVSVTDSGLTLSCDQTLPVATLAVGASIRCHAARTVTQADVDAGSMSNLASAAGSDLLGNPVSGVAAVTVPGPPARPSLSITKRASVGSVSTVGELVRYTFEVVNTGNITVENVTVTDPKVSDLVCPQTLLAPGQSMLCTASLLVTQADLDGGSLVNLATVSGTPARGVLSPASDTESVQAQQRPALVVNKTASPLAFRAEGDEITYTVVATNTGNVTLKNVTVTDPKVTLTCTPTTPVATLAPGAQVACSGSYAVTQADVDAGSLANTASAAGLDPSGSNVSDTAGVSVDGPAPNPQVSLSKVASPSLFSSVGQTVTYTLVATNTGNVTLTDVAITDPFLSGIRCTPGATARLVPNASLTCTGTHVVTQAELDSGTILNTASVSGRTPLDAEVTDTASLTIEGVPPVPGLTVVKTASPAAYTGEGDVITWTIVTTNTGTATLSNVDVEDAAGSVECGETLPLATLAPGDSLTCAVTTTVSAADVERGSVTNTASASGSATGGAPVSASDTATADGPVPNPRLSMVKTSSGAFSKPGDTVTFTIVATNTGNVTLEDVTLDDPGLTLLCDPVLPVASLGVGASITCTADRLITQADVDAGSIHNDVSGTAKTPSGAPVTAQAAVDVPGPAPSPALSMIKRASVGSVSAPGEVVRYTFEVTNAGNVSISNIVLTDPSVSDLVCPQTVLGSGQSMVCSATYVVTQADVDRGSVTNLASVTGTPARGVLPPGEASSVVGVTQRPSLAVNKSVLPVAYRTAGEVLTFTVVATNTGNVTLSDVTVTDPKVTLSCSPASPVASLAPGASVVCLGSYPVTQTDVDAGSLANTASAAGTSPLGEDITDSATLNVPGPASVPQLSLSKVAAQSSYTVPGDQIEYTLVATNTGNVSLYNVTVTDPLLSGITCSRTLPTGLLPGASVTCTGTYTVTQADIDGGSVTNSASASGAPRGGTPVSASASNTVDGVPPVPRLTVTKTATPAAFSTVGDTVTWTIVVRNTGLATLTNLGVSDSLGSLDCTPTIPIDTFAPGDTVSCTYTATVTAEDAERGSIVNTASATATGPGDSEVTASDTHVVNGPAPRPRLSVTKTASPSAFSEPGETITYTIVVTNTGNVPLEDVTVTDPGHILDCDASLPVATLDIGDSIICTTSTVTTQADVDAGSIHNDAAATGSTPLGAPVGAQAAVDVPGPVANPALSLDKTASPSKITNSGQRVTFTFTVTNVGNVTADNVQIVDPRLDAPATCDETRLAPGESTTCTGVYTVRTADLHGNGLVNSAVAASDAARGYMRSSVDSANVPVDPPELPPTGGGSGALPAALVMTLAGLLLLGTSRRRRLHT